MTGTSVAPRNTFRLLAGFALASSVCSGCSPAAHDERPSGPDASAAGGSGGAPPGSGGSVAEAGPDGSSGHREWITITPAGLQHTFENGITLKVPAGAVATDTPFYLRSLGPDEIDFLLRGRNVTWASILFALEGTDGTRFDKDVTLVIPVAGIEPRAIPILHTLDLRQETFTQQPGTLSLHPAAKTLELAVRHFSALSGEQSAELNAGATDECTNAQTACRCGNITVVQGEGDYSCSDRSTNCGIVTSRGSVTFNDCDASAGTTESYLFEEVSDGCKGHLSVTASQEIIAPGEQVRVDAQLTLGCEAAAGVKGGPMANQNVGFQSSGAGTVPPGNAVSDDNGKASTYLTGGQTEGTAAVTATAIPKYVTHRIAINGVTEGTTTWGPETAVTTSLDIAVSPAPVLTLTADKTMLFPGGTATISATVSRKDQPLAGQAVSYSVIGPATVEPTSSTTSADQAATTRLTPTAETGSATVTAQCQTRVEIDSKHAREYLLKQEISVSICSLNGTWQGPYSGQTISCAGRDSNGVCIKWGGLKDFSGTVAIPFTQGGTSVTAVIAGFTFAGTNIDGDVNLTATLPCHASTSTCPGQITGTVAADCSEFSGNLLDDRARTISGTFTLYPPAAQ